MSLEIVYPTQIWQSLNNINIKSVVKFRCYIGFFLWRVLYHYYQQKHFPTCSWWRHQMETFSAYWPFVRGIHRSPVNSQHKGQWRGAFTFSLICAWINRWVNNGEAGDLRPYHAHYDVIVMSGDPHDLSYSWYYDAHMTSLWCSGESNSPSNLKTLRVKLYVRKRMAYTMAYHKVVDIVPH